MKSGMARAGSTHELMLKEFQVVDSIREKISMLEEELDDNRKKADEFHAQMVSY